MAGFDVIRGFSVVSMVLFHLCYDLRFIYGYRLDWFAPPLQDIWRASISWTFLLVAGCMCSFSRNGFKRAQRYLLVAGAVYVVTSVAAVDTPISFGIIFCMGASTLIEAFLKKTHLAPQGPAAFLILFCIFLLTRGVGAGHIGLGSYQLQLPDALYATPYFSWLGFPGPQFMSGDYYPVIPYALLYLAGSALGRTMRTAGYPAWLSTLSCPPLEWVGQHALPIYVLHQPLIIGLLDLLA